MSPTLNHLMHRATDDTEPDLDALAHAARRRGLGIRRRRQALGLVGAAAATAVVLGGAQVVGGVRGDVGSAPQDRVASAPAPTPATVRASGLTTATIFVEALAQVADGTAERVEGQGDGIASSSSDTFAKVRWQPADGSGVSVVQVNVQPGFDSPEIYECRAWQSQCRVVTRADGSRVMSYSEMDASDGGGDVRRAVDLLRADGVRVVASEANGFDKPSNVFDVTRPQPSLTRAQLLRIVEDPAFGDPVDAAYAEPDRQVRGYIDLDETVDEGWYDEVPPGE